MVQVRCVHDHGAILAMLAASRPGTDDAGGDHCAGRRGPLFHLLFLARKARFMRRRPLPCQIMST